MNNWFSRLIPQDKKKLDEIESQKSAILNNKKDTLDSLRNINKKFRLIIESGQIEVVVKDITDITKKK